MIGWRGGWKWLNGWMKIGFIKDGNLPKHHRTSKQPAAFCLPPFATCSNSQFFPAARPWGPLWDWVEPSAWAPSAQPLAKITYSFTQLTNLVWLWICWAPRIASACRWKGCWIQEISHGGLVSLWADVYNIPAAVDDFRSTEVCSEDLFRRCPL